MVRVSILGKMVADMKVNTSMTRNMDLVSTCGLTEEDTKDSGDMESKKIKQLNISKADNFMKNLIAGNTARVSTYCQIIQ